MNRHEEEIVIDRPGQVIKKFLDNKQSLKILLSDTEEKENILDDASRDINHLTTDETVLFLGLVLNGLSRDDEEWDVDKRDGAFELLTIVDFGSVQSAKLYRYYLNAVSFQGANSDPYGSIYSLLQTGKLIAAYFPPGENTRIDVSTAWNIVSNQFIEESCDFVRSDIKEIINSIPLTPEQQRAVTEDEYDIRPNGRDMPQFEPAEKELHNKYLETVKNRKTFKLHLWDNTPKFRALCESHGIALGKFWNINDPDEVTAALKKVNWQKFPHAQTHFSRALKLETGLTLDELTDENSKVLADEIIYSALRAKDSITHSISVFGNPTTKFIDLIQGSQEKNPKACRLIVEEIVNFFQKNGISMEKTDQDSLLSYLANPDFMQQAKDIFSENQASKEKSAQILEDIFSLKNKSKEFTLSSRTRQDLFLGDLTGDCTAYHLKAGINAWTVPVWLSNPGFNFYKITLDDHLVAKLGIILAIADNEPVLVVDSFETASAISDESAAISQINKALALLKGWSERIGLKDVLLNTYSNSGGASDLLRSYGERSYASKIHVLGGLSGVSELRETMTAERIHEQIYLQSERDLSEAEDDDYINYTLQFESLIREALYKTDDENRSKMEDFARSGNWAELFTFIVKINFPSISKCVGSDWTHYRNFLSLIEIDELGDPFRVDSNSKYFIDQFPVSAIVEEQIVEDAVAQGRDGLTSEDYDEDQKQQIMEAVEVDNLLILLKQLKRQNLSPENALKDLFGSAVTEQSEPHGMEELALNPRLRRLKII